MTDDKTLARGSNIRGLQALGGALFAGSHMPEHLTMSCQDGILQPSLAERQRREAASSPGPFYLGDRPYNSDHPSGPAGGSGRVVTTQPAVFGLLQVQQHGGDFHCERS